MTISPALKNAYAFHRALYENKSPRHVLASPVIALELARADVANGKTRYAPYPPSIHEKPEAFGLRHIGDVEADCGGRNGYFSTRGTCGWFTDPHGNTWKDGTGSCWGVVYQLPGHKRRSRFVAGYQMGGCDAGLTLDLTEVFTCVSTGDSASDLDACKEAARRADKLAYDAAESERDYQSAWRLGSLYSELGETIASERKEALALLAERRKVKGSDGYPAICKAIRSTVQGCLVAISDARAKRAEYKKGEGVRDLCVWLGGPDNILLDAFNEGAGETVFT
jgi:hypothetical protein